jgi:hypothetical protein
VEVLVHDDASTDSTPAILEEYSIRYPGLIRVIRQSVNQYSQGHRILPLVVPECRGEFVAICEGDDFWTDQTKLQLQQDLLREHPNVSACFHDSTTIRQENEAWVAEFNTTWPRDEVLTEDLLEGNPAMTCTAFLRSEAFPRNPELFQGLKMGDLPLWIFYSLKGPILWIHRNMGAYRLHGAGSWSNKPQSQMHYAIFECIAGMGELPSRLGVLHRSAVAMHLARYAVHLDKEQEGKAEVPISRPMIQPALGLAEWEVFCDEYLNRSSWVFDGRSETCLPLLKRHLTELGCSGEQFETMLSKHYGKATPEETPENAPSIKPKSWFGRIREDIERLAGVAKLP